MRTNDCLNVPEETASHPDALLQLPEGWVFPCLHRDPVHAALKRFEGADAGLLEEAAYLLVKTLMNTPVKDEEDHIGYAFKVSQRWADMLEMLGDENGLPASELWADVQERLHADLTAA